MWYSFSTGEAVINPDEMADAAGGLVLEDVYDLTIDIDHLNKKVVVRELDGRIRRVSSRRNLKSAYVHVYQDGSLCLCPLPEEKLLFLGGFSLPRLFYGYLIPYLYYQTYLAKFGTEPWRSSSHDAMGILESYARQSFPEVPLQTLVDYYMQSLPADLSNLIATNKRIDQDLSCVCNSKEKFSACHTLSFEGFRELHADYWLLKSGKSKKAERSPAV
jgi:hypothetical protein